MLVNGKNILNKANKKKYAVGAFNINNVEIAQAVIRAAEKLNSPVILQISEGAIKYAGLDNIFDIAKNAAESVKVPVAIHLDHGRDMDVIRKCIGVGFTSVMIDASHESFDENINLTKKVVSMAKRKKIGVEAELGTIGGKEENIKSKNIKYTDPDKAKEFVNKTKIDYLAVAIGTSHGAYKFRGKAELRFDILKQIKEKVKKPLVLHGASEIPKSLVDKAKKYGAKLKNPHGVPDNQIIKAVKLGINKINTDTDLRLAFGAAIRKFLKTHPKDIDPRHMLSPAINAMQQVVEHRIKVFGSKNEK